MIDLNMGCPVPKVLQDRRRRGAASRPRPRGRGRAAAIEGSRAAGDRQAALGARARATARASTSPGGSSPRPAWRRSPFHPRPAAVSHRGAPDYDARRASWSSCGGRAGDRLRRAERPPTRARRAYERSGADAVMIARGSLGNPWIFERAAGERRPSPRRGRDRRPSCAGCSTAPRSIWGAERAARNLRKFYPWYVERLGFSGPEADRFQRTESLDEVRDLLARRAGRAERRIAIIARRLGPVYASQARALRAFFQRRRPAGEEDEDAVAREALITQEGLEKLKTEIEHLSTDKRREVAARIKEAREFGDIAENSEYDDAKNEQALLEQRIAQLEERLRRATRDRREGDRHRRRSASASASTSRTRSRASRGSSRSSARPRPTRPSRSSPTSRRSARRCSATSAARSSPSTSRAGRRRSSRSPRSRPRSRPQVI